jgi:hypothetical protein
MHVHALRLGGWASLMIDFISKSRHTLQPDSDIPQESPPRVLTLSESFAYTPVEEAKMPDLDLFQRSLGKHWRVPYRLTEGNHPLESVAKALVGAVAATIREDGGVPCFASLCETIYRAIHDANGAELLAEATRAIEQRYEQQRAVKLAARAAQQNHSKLLCGEALPGSVSLAQDYVSEILRHNFFSKINDSKLVGTGKRFSDMEEARKFESNLWSSTGPQLRRLAQQLAIDPSASRLRAPASPMPRRTTAELLDMTLA